MVRNLPIAHPQEDRHPPIPPPHLSDFCCCFFLALTYFVMASGSVCRKKHSIAAWHADAESANLSVTDKLGELRLQL